MAVELTITVPDALGRELESIQERLPEVLERGLRDLQSAPSEQTDDERAIVQLLTSFPTVEQVLALRPSAELQARIHDLLARSKESTLSSKETIELERYLFLEHLVRMAKVNAYRRRAYGT